ncbi:MAG: CFI-box-CTERM domain-containing protein [Syntrophomonadaceae bacterium]|jgi:hypothetical protein
MCGRVAKIMVIAVLLLFGFNPMAMGSGITADLNPDNITIPGSVTVSGQAPADSFVSIKIVDTEQNVVYFEAVKADVSGLYSHNINFIDNDNGVFYVIAGTGANIARQLLTIGVPTGSVTMDLSVDSAAPGSSVTVSGNGDPDAWVPLQVVDSEGKIWVFDAVKANVDGKYSIDFTVPDGVEGNLDIIVGYPNNYASQTLMIGNMTQNVTINLNTDTAMAGDTITVSGTADPNTWVVLKVVDGEGAVLVFDAVKANADGEYSIEFIVPESAEGDLTVVAGYGENVASQSLSVTGVMDECFIATAAFGSKFEPSVVLLRSFRDQYLLSNALGRTFVEFYYQNSPALANQIADNEMLKCIVRILLIPCIVIVYLLFHPILILGLAGIMLLYIIAYRVRKSMVY